MKTMHIALLGAFLTAAAGAASAEPFDGPYLAVEGAYDNYKQSPDDGRSIAVIAGYDKRFAGDWVIGANVGYGFNKAKEAVVEESTTQITTTRVKLEDDLRGKVRAGRVFGDILAFVDVGYERFDVDASQSVKTRPCATGTCTTVTDLSFREKAWTFGGGIEWAATENLRLRASYSYGDGEAFKRHRIAAAVGLQF